MSIVEKSIRLYAWRANYRVFDVVQDEVLSRQFNIQLMEATTPVDLSDCRVYFHAEKPDGNTCYIRCEIVDVSLGLIRFKLTHQMVAVDGMVNCFIQVISESDTDLRFDGMSLNVKECNLTESAESSSEFPALVEALAEVRPATERADAATQRANASADNADRATSEADKATAAANKATSNANKATSDATAAKEAAQKATSDADKATAACVQATSASAEQTSKCLNATTKAEAATSEAKDATNAANVGAGLANSAAASATSAANAANNAADYANNAKQNAIAATAQANEAATRANQAATGVEDATERANQAAQSAEDVREEITDETYAMVADEFAKRGQLKPDFVNDIDDCEDTSKVYVLPDGMIYGYVKVKTTRPTYTNKYDKASAMRGYRLGSGGAATSDADTFVTNYIQVLPSTTYTVRLLTVSNFGDGNDRLSEYSAASESNHVAQTRGSAMTVTTESNGSKCFTFTTQSTTKFIRLSIQFDIGSFDNLILTLNEPIGEETIIGYQWANTGHAFVPADYEQRIIDLERTVQGAVNSGGAPDYVIDEAKEVAKRVAGVKTVNSFSFIAGSDVHYSNGSATPDSVVLAGMGAEYVRRFTHIDLFAMMGDFINGGDGDKKEGATEEFLAIHKALYLAGNGVRQLWLRGNHDRLLQSGGTTATDEEFNLNEMYTHIGSMNDESVSGDNAGGYGYMDFEARKIRVIYLNTSDDNGTYVWCTPAQIQWLVNNAFNLSGKATPAEWGIVVMSHVPLWGGVFDYLASVVSIIDAYNARGSGNVTIGSTQVNYNFGAQKGEVICLVNGHTHNFATNRTPGGIPGFSIPNICASRYNEYANSTTEAFKVWGEVDSSGKAVYHTKTKDTAKGTSFNVVTIDRQNRKIYAHVFGAGIDREMTY